MGALVAGLARNLNETRILLNTRLLRVNRKSDQIIAALESDGNAMEISAQQIILAIPPRVIAETVAFHPALSLAQSNALRSVPTWMAGQAKFIAVYDKPHWRNSGLSGDAMSRRGPMTEIHDASPITGGPYALFGFVGLAPDARDAHKANLKEMAIVQLTALFGPNMARPIGIILQDWASVPEVATSLDRQPLHYHPNYGLPAPLKGLSDLGIHFASTETAAEFGGYLEGALEAAENVRFWET